MPWLPLRASCFFAPADSQEMHRAGQSAPSASCGNFRCCSPRTGAKSAHVFPPPRQTSLMKLPHILLVAALTGAASFTRGAEAASIWANECAKCHGEDGKGQTKMG